MLTLMERHPLVEFGMLGEIVYFVDTYIDMSAGTKLIRISPNEFEIDKNL